MTSGARALTQCGKKRMQMRGEATLMWKKSRRLCVSELCGCLTSLEKPAQLVSWCLPVTVTVSCLP